MPGSHSTQGMVSNPSSVLLDLTSSALHGCKAPEVAAVMQRRHREIGVLPSDTCQRRLSPLAWCTRVLRSLKAGLLRQVETGAEDGRSRAKSPPALVTGVCLRTVSEVWAQCSLAGQWPVPSCPPLPPVSPLPDQLQAGFCTLRRELSLCQHEPVNGLESYTTSRRFQFLLLLV